MSASTVSLPVPNLRRYVTSLEVVGMVYDHINALSFQERTYLNTTSEVAAYIFNNKDLFKEISEKLKPLPRFNYKGAAEVKKKVDKTREYLEAIEELLIEHNYNVIITGLPEGGKTFTIGRIPQVVSSWVEAEKQRVRNEAIFEARLKQLRLEQKKLGVSSEEIERFEDYGRNIACFHKDLNLLRVFASGTDIDEKAMGVNAPASKKVEKVTLYLDSLFRLGFLILPGQTSYKKYAARAIATELIENGKTKTESIDPIIDRSMNNYVSLFANIANRSVSNNNRDLSIFDEDSTYELVHHVLSGEQTGYTTLLQTFQNWFLGEGGYESLRNELSNSLEKPKEMNRKYNRIVDKIEEMTNNITKIGLTWLAPLFQEAALWDTYSVIRPNIKVMNVTFTGTDLKNEVGKQIFEKYEELARFGHYTISDEVREKYDNGASDDLWDDLFAEINKFLNPFIHPTFKNPQTSIAPYFELTAYPNRSKEELDAPLLFLGALCKSIIGKDIQINLVDKQIQTLHPVHDLDKIEYLVDKGFKVGIVNLDGKKVDYLRAVYDKKKSEGNLNLSLSNLLELMTRHEPEDLAFSDKFLIEVVERVKKHRSEFPEDYGFEVPLLYMDRYNEILTTADGFIQMLDTAIKVLNSGHVFEDAYIDHHKQKYESFKEKFPEHKSRIIESKFEDYDAAYKKALEKSDLGQKGIKKIQQADNLIPATGFAGGPPQGLKPPGTIKQELQQMIDQDTVAKPPPEGPPGTVKDRQGNTLEPGQGTFGASPRGMLMSELKQFFAQKRNKEGGARFGDS